MSFRVHWTKRARRELADLWIRASDRNAVTAAANAIDARLSRDPAQEGEDRDRGSRLLFEDPLWVLFRVDHRQNQVDVIAISRTSPPP